MDRGPPITSTSHRLSQGVFSHRCLRKASAANTVIIGLEGSAGIAGVMSVIVSGLSSPDVGVIVARCRGYRCPMSGLSLPELCLHIFLVAVNSMGYMLISPNFTA